jgi:hypothetical protein
MEARGLSTAQGDSLGESSCFAQDDNGVKFGFFLLDGVKDEWPPGVQPGGLISPDISVGRMMSSESL